MNEQLWEERFANYNKWLEKDIRPRPEEKAAVKKKKYPNEHWIVMKNRN